MSSPTPSHPSDAGFSPAARKLRLSVPSPTQQQQRHHDLDEWRHSVQNDEERCSTPSRPSYSPVTPTLPEAPGLRDVAARQAEWTERPDPTPVSLDENPDAIALRAAISILQMQRQQSLRDIRKLDQMKAAALEHPQAFVDQLTSGRLNSTPPAGLIDVGDADDGTAGAAGLDAADATGPVFGKLPLPQNVVRSPPVNWDKYHVVGESLDKLHEQQRRHPGIADLELDGASRDAPHAVAAPYRPFVDKLDARPLDGMARNEKR